MTWVTRSAPASYRRMVELAIEDGFTGPSAVARVLHIVPQAFTNWRRVRGVSLKAAMTMETSLGWSAAYIMSAKLPKRHDNRVSVRLRAFEWQEQITQDNTDHTTQHIKWPNGSIRTATTEKFNGNHKTKADDLETEIND